MTDWNFREPRAGVVGCDVRDKDSNRAERERERERVRERSIGPVVMSESYGRSERKCIFCAKTIIVRKS